MNASAFTSVVGSVFRCP